MENVTSQGLSGFAELKYIEPGQSKFTLTPGGFLSLSIGPDEKYPRVNLYRAFPFTHPREYISVRDTEGKEIGIIESIDTFSTEAVEFIEKELDRRYFKPVITSITSIKEEFGYLYWTAQTDAGTRRFTTRGPHESLIRLTDTRILLVDVDGNRYEIIDCESMDEKSLKILSLYL